MRTLVILTLIILLTLWGDYLIKQAADRPAGLTSFALLLGGSLYGITAIGWFFLMRSHSLAAVGVFYSTMSLLLLVGLGYFAFKEPLGPREALSVSLALLSIIVMGGDH
jgi:drug/metabolite transporter (DMT)-like permease